MRTIGMLIAISFFLPQVYAQSLLQGMFDAQLALNQSITENGPNAGFNGFLSEDAVLFRPGPVNGKKFLTSSRIGPSGVAARKIDFADISVNGLLGYSYGEWKLTQKLKTGEDVRNGQYATVWRKTPDGRYRAVLDIEISHDAADLPRPPGPLPTAPVRDRNERGWSAADTTMNFFRLSMASDGLGGAYRRFAAEDVRLLREGMPPIIGKRDVMKQTERYVSIEYPTQVTQFETADLAYSWNPCKFSNSNEGLEEGHCLHIWKLRDEKWWIVLGVFSKMADPRPPSLRERN
ncbi:MAG: hypothetical protein AB7Q37_10065 [Pyrinomonadaceae bacterium]